MKDAVYSFAKKKKKRKIEFVPQSELGLSLSRLKGKRNQCKLLTFERSRVPVMLRASHTGWICAAAVQIEFVGPLTYGNITKTLLFF